MTAVNFEERDLLITVSALFAHVISIKGGIKCKCPAKPPHRVNRIVLPWFYLGALCFLGFAQLTAYRFNQDTDKIKRQDRDQASSQCHCYG